MKTKKLLFTLLMMIFFAEISSAQIMFQKTYQGTSTNDYAGSVKQTTDGGYIIIGNDGGDIYLLKSDANGSILWTKNFSPTINFGGGTSTGNSVQQTTDGGYILTGGDCDGTVLIKTNSVGDTLWTQNYTDANGFSVQQTTDGGYIITGGCGGGFFIIKTNTNGDTLWTRKFDGRGYSVQQTSDGGYVVVGFTFGAGSDDVYLIKTDSNGNLLWSRTFGGTSGDEGYSVQQTTDGGYIITGETFSF